MPIFRPVEKICGKAVNSLWKLVKFCGKLQVFRTKPVDIFYPQVFDISRMCRKSKLSFYSLFSS